MFSKNFAVKEDGLRCLHKTLSDYKRGDKSSKPYMNFHLNENAIMKTNLESLPIALSSYYISS